MQKEERREMLRRVILSLKRAQDYTSLEPPLFDDCEHQLMAGAEMLVNAFSWSDTIEGPLFWHYVSDRLEDIADGATE